MMSMGAGCSIVLMRRGAHLALSLVVLSLAIADVSDGLHDGALLHGACSNCWQEGSVEEIVAWGDQHNVVLLGVLLVQRFQEGHGTPARAQDHDPGLAGLGDIDSSRCL